jgi:hypothetical protein
MGAKLARPRIVLNSVAGSRRAGSGRTEEAVGLEYSTDSLQLFLKDLASSIC